MPLLLDTCTLFWLSSNQKDLSKNSQDALVEHAGDLFVSAISALEFVTNVAKGKMRLPSQLPSQDAILWFRKILAQHEVSQIPINFQIAGQSGKLPLHHKDPFDRIIIATALEYKMTIVTPDKLIRQYSEVECLW